MCFIFKLILDIYIFLLLTDYGLVDKNYKVLDYFDDRKIIWQKNNQWQYTEEFSPKKPNHSSSQTSIKFVHKQKVVNLKYQNIP